MTSSKKVANSVPRRSGRVVRKVLANGTVKEYRYGPHRPRPSRFAEDTLGGLIAAFKNSLEWASLAPSTRTVYTMYLRPLQDSPETLVKHVLRRELLQLRDSIAQARGRGAAANFVRSASTLFNWAVDRGVIEQSPAYRVKPPEGGTLPAWTAEQVALALSTLPEIFRRVVLLAAHTGQRRGDLLTLRWSDYKGETIELTQQKTGQPMTIHVSPELRAELDAWRREGRIGTVLADERGRPWSPVLFSQRFRRALQKIGLPDGLGIHGVRKYLAADLASEGATAHQIASVTGHRTLGMVAHYTRSADQAQMNRDAIGRLSKRMHNRTTESGK